jgi:NAD(P)-dependent dehydrogenase (short-subunit alcohol dehydrogenase family)
MAMTQRKVAVITGGASGIGRAFAAQAVARGMAVAIADIEGERAVATAAELGNESDVRGYACDVTDPESLARLAQDVACDFGGVNYLFNNAGVCVGRTVEATDAKDAQWMLTVNVIGLINTTQALLPLLHGAAGRGEPARIINTGSENSVGLPALGQQASIPPANMRFLACPMRCAVTSRTAGLRFRCCAPALFKRKSMTVIALAQPILAESGKFRLNAPR